MEVGTVDDVGTVVTLDTTAAIDRGVDCTDSALTFSTII